MISDMKFRPKSTNMKGKRVFLLTLIFALAIFLISLVLPAYQGVVQMVSLALLTVSLYYYNRYLATSYEYEITTDYDGTPVFVVASYQKKRTSTLCRIALWDVTSVKRYKREELAALPKDREVAVFKYNPTLSPDFITVVSVRSTHEKSDLHLETSEDFDAYFLSLVEEAKGMRQTSQYE